MMAAAKSTAAQAHSGLAASRWGGGEVTPSFGGVWG